MKWIGTIAGVSGSLLLASNIPQSGYGYLLFLISSVSWFIVAVRMKESSLMVLQRMFTCVNILGIVRWLII